VCIVCHNMSNALSWVYGRCAQESLNSVHTLFPFVISFKGCKRSNPVVPPVLLDCAGKPIFRFVPRRSRRVAWSSHGDAPAQAEANKPTLPLFACLTVCYGLGAKLVSCHGRQHMTFDFRVRKVHVQQGPFIGSGVQFQELLQPRPRREGAAVRA